MNVLSRPILNYIICGLSCASVKWEKPYNKMFRRVAEANLRSLYIPDLPSPLDRTPLNAGTLDHHEDTKQKLLQLLSSYIHSTILHYTHNWKRAQEHQISYETDKIRNWLVAYSTRKESMIDRYFDCHKILNPNDKNQHLLKTFEACADVIQNYDMDLGKIFQLSLDAIQHLIAIDYAIVHTLRANEMQCPYRGGASLRFHLAHSFGWGQWALLLGRQWIYRDSQRQWGTATPPLPISHKHTHKTWSVNRWSTPWNDYDDIGPCDLRFPGYSPC